MNDTITTGPWEAWVRSMGSATTRNRGMYVHVPYCSSRCGYCDFNTYTPQEIDVAASEYVSLALGEIDLASDIWSGRGIDTVFIGGGTPTLLDTREIASILSRIDDRFGLNPNAEITVEANPDSVDEASLAALRGAGVSRISFGVQSLSPHVLAVLDRTHSPGRSLAAIGEARDAGFEHVSADLIYATPGESDGDLEASVRGVLAEGVDHVSAYSLIVEPGTRLAGQVQRGEIPAVDDDIAANRYQLIDSVLAEHGFDWYEVSNWSRPGGECRHNLGYWRDGDWWAIGPGAHGHLRDGGRALRWWNVKYPARYAQRIGAGTPPVAEWEELDAATIQLERIMLGLRLREGIDRELIGEDRCGTLDDLAQRGWVSVTDDRVRLTDAGRLLADAVIRELT